MKNLIYILYLMSPLAFSQTIEKFSIDSGGDSATSGDIQILYTIGEVNVQEFNSAAIYVSEGFISPYFNNILLNLEDFYSPSTIKLYPNPASEFINIKFSIPLKEVNIFNVSGIKVMEAKHTNLIEVKNLVSGVYLVEAIAENYKRYFIKFIKK